MLTTRDIMNDLGVTKQTVLRWISAGKISGTIESRRGGWKFEDADYEAFLNRDPRWKAVHNGELYSSNERKAREEALEQIIAQIITSKGTIKLENRNESYINGFERAITDIQAAINREMARKIPAWSSRSEQSA